MTFQVEIARDAESGVFYVQHSDIPGLHAEASTIDELVGIITDVVPELVAANCLQTEDRLAPKIPLRIEHVTYAELSAAC